MEARPWATIRPDVRRCLRSEGLCFAQRAKAATRVALQARRLGTELCDFCFT